jgi:hypothetical protein
MVVFWELPPSIVSQTRHLPMLDCSIINSLTCPPAMVQRVKHQCPKDLSQLTELLLRDLPSYASRVSQRRRKKLAMAYSSYLVAGRPETIPQLIANPEYSPANSSAAPLQLYLSTLERQYNNGKSIDIQQFHWVFLVRGQQDWHLVTMYSRLGQNAQDPMLLPPIESIDSPVGEAVKIWLRDCNAGAVNP